MQLNKKCIERGNMHKIKKNQILSCAEDWDQQSSQQAIIQLQQSFQIYSTI